MKAAFYFLMGYPMLLSGVLYRLVLSPGENNKNLVRVHLGPGQGNYKSGWINVDANIISAKLDVWSDFRNRLPFRNASVDAFYSHHVVEHLPDDFLQFHFNEMYRCLKVGGMIRVGGPNAEEAFGRLFAGDSSWFEPYRHFPLERSSIGGMLNNFLLCRGEHLTILTKTYLEELLRSAGFTNISFYAPIEETGAPELFSDIMPSEFELSPRNPHTLIVEARK
jgi:predicted SAM-dependent methyltransferase